jgi:hypothetical protein
LPQVIKDANYRFVRKFEMDYSTENKKTTNLAPKLGRIYIEGKIVEKNFQRAKEILSVSCLIKSKYMLMRIAMEEKNYTDAFYYAEYLNNSK